MYSYRYGYVDSNPNNIIYIIIIIIIAAFILHIFLARAVSLMAEEKGYDRSTWFAWCFFTGIMGFIAVCAMPDKKMHELLNRNNFLLAKILSETPDNNKPEKEKMINVPNPETGKQKSPGAAKHPSETDNHQEMKEKPKSQLDSQTKNTSAPQISDSQQEKYQKAMNLWGNGQKREAEKLLAEIPDWKDAAALLNKIRIEIADDAMKQEDFDTALSYYQKTGKQQ